MPSHFEQFCQTIAHLRGPEGCPWDREQTLESLLPYLVEETYEVVDALHAGDVRDHAEELDILGSGVRGTRQLDLLDPARRRGAEIHVHEILVEIPGLVAGVVAVVHVDGDLCSARAAAVV